MNSNTNLNHPSSSSGGLANDSNNNNPNVLHQSKDAQTIISVLKDMGIDEFEPRVINQLLEFSYRKKYKF